MCNLKMDKGETVVATSIFTDKAVVPNDNMVDTVLADKKPLWDKLKSHVAENYQGINREWKMYSKKAGWNLVFKKEKRTLFYFVPCDHYFMIAFVFGTKAVDTAMQSDISDNVKKEIFDADVCASGHTFITAINNEQDLGDVITLLRIKDES